MCHVCGRSSDEEVVVLSQVLACDATLGYEEIYNTQVSQSVSRTKAKQPSQQLTATNRISAASTTLQTHNQAGTRLK